MSARAYSFWQDHYMKFCHFGMKHNSFNQSNSFLGVCEKYLVEGDHCSELENWTDTVAVEPDYIVDSCPTLLLHPPHIPWLGAPLPRITCFIDVTPFLKIYIKFLKVYGQGCLTLVMRCCNSIKTATVTQGCLGFLGANHKPMWGSEIKKLFSVPCFL